MSMPTGMEYLRRLIGYHDTDSEIRRGYSEAVELYEALGADNAQYAVSERLEVERAKEAGCEVGGYRYGLWRALQLMHDKPMSTKPDNAPE